MAALSLCNSAMVRRDPVLAGMKRSSQWLQTQRCICGHYAAVVQGLCYISVAMFLCNGEKPVCLKGHNHIESLWETIEVLELV